MNARIQVKIKARAKRSGIAGRLGKLVKIDIAAPPVERRANEELIRFLAELAAIPRSAVRIIAGASSPLKLIEMDGVSEEQLNKLLP